VPTGLQTGDVFTFTGTVVEGVDRPADRFRRCHALELRVFVLDRQENSADVAVLTRLTRTDDVVSGAVGVVTGNQPEKTTPPSVHLDIVRVYSDGTVHLLVPPGPPPLKFAADTPARALPPIPLDGFSPAEFGVFPPRIPRNNRGEPWTLTATGNRPVETWQAKEFQFVNAERCQLLLMNQQSDDWAKPVGGQTSWHRADAVLVSTQDGTARRVHRVIRQRDGRSETPAAWVEVKYELKEQTQLSGRTFDHARIDCEVAYNALAEATMIRPDMAKPGAKTIETRLANLDFQLEKMDRTNPYREALLAARRAIDATRRGEAAPVSPSPSPPPPIPTQTRSLWPEAGQVAPDFKAGTFHLADQRGKPVVLVFFRPGGETTDLSLSIADALEKRYTGKAVVSALCVFADSSAGVKDRDRLKFTVPVYDGTAAATSYGVETAPRFALIDPEGKVRWVFTGVGAETGFLLKEQADRLVAPASRTSVNGTIAPIGLPLPPIVTRP
jgi:hypothetical protein